MPEAPHFGRCLSGEEFDRQITMLYADLPVDASPEVMDQVRRKEFEITVSYRLGVDFPQTRREKLWLLHLRVQRMPLKLIFKYMLKKVIPQRFNRATQKMASGVIEEYGKELSHDELQMFFGKDEVDNPALPIDFPSER